MSLTKILWLGRVVLWLRLEIMFSRLTRISSVPTYKPCRSVWYILKVTALVLT